MDGRAVWAVEWSGAGRERDILVSQIATFVTNPVTDDTTLLERARHLDARALTQIHDQYYPELYRFALYRTDDPETAQDIAGEVFLRLLDALHAGRAPQTSLRGWLFGVAAHLVADHFRRAPTVPLDEELTAGVSPSGEAEERLQKQAVRRALQQLTHEQQDVLGLRFGDGFSIEKTAEALGKSVMAVKALQFRAVEALRRALTKNNTE
jgi:RNA polymerase sigma-70 factor (ECF subfamily)